MDNAILLIRFWAFYLIITATIFIIRPSTKRRIMEMIKDPSLMMLMGFMAMIIGLFSLTYYHEWNNDITIIPTIFGYVALLKGISLIAFPETTSDVAKWADNKFFPILIVIILFLGLALLYYGGQFF